MKTFIKCFPRCLNCTRKLIGSGARPTSGCRTRFRCQNSFTPRWYSTFKRGDGNVSSAKPKKINDHQSEIYGLLGQCPQSWSSQKGRGGRMEWERVRKVMRPVCQKSTGLDPSAGFFQVPQSNLDLNYIKETKTVFPEKTTCTVPPPCLSQK